MKTTKTTTTKGIYKVEHLFDENNDRWIYIEYNDNNKVIGLNFMQGNDYKLFKDCFCTKDYSLTAYYSEMQHVLFLEKAHSPLRIDFINTIFWSYLSAVKCFKEVAFCKQHPLRDMVE